MRQHLKKGPTMPNTKLPHKNATYAEAGVNIDAGNALVEKIKPLAKSTSRTGLMGGIGGFGALFDLKACGYKDPILVSGTDGVGTKIKIAQHLNRHDTIGIDLVAMCVNDLIVQGAAPLFFLDYFATSALDVGVAEAVIKGIAEGCKQAGCALAGGETAEMPGIYQKGEYDLAGFAVGAVEREDVLPKTLSEGDVLLGLSSSGVHSNGYSLVRHLLEKQKIDLRDKQHSQLAERLLVPTRIYVASCLAAIRTGAVKALAHITGGGITDNLPRVLPDGLSAQVDVGAWSMPPIFEWLEQAGNMTQAEMRRTFNCGIGMIVVVSPERAREAVAAFTTAGETVQPIGKLVARKNERVVYA
jgi:phosphoribosylaminoimidazole synthetase